MATYWENSCSFGLRYVSWYKYLIVSLVFSHLGFWSENGSKNAEILRGHTFKMLCILETDSTRVHKLVSNNCYDNVL